MFSKYVHTIKTQSGKSLYNALTTKLFILSETQFREIKNDKPLQSIFNSQQCALLSQKGFLRGDNEADLTEIVKFNRQEKPDLFALYLILTEECNMNCLYCSQSSFRTRKIFPAMSLDTIEHSLSKFYNSRTDRKRVVVLYGGEPTVNKSGVIHAINCIRNVQGDDNCEIVIFTNGFNVDSELIDFFAAQGVSVIISLDGNKATHDKFRLCGNQGTFEKVNDTINQFKEKKISFGISATIAAHNVDRLDDLVNYFCDNYNPFSIGFNPLHYPPPNRKSISVDYDTMADKMIAAYDTAAQRGVYIEQIMRRVRPFVLAQPRLKDCPSCGGMIRVLPDGSFGPCGHFMEEKKEMEKNQQSFSESQLLSKWNTRLIFTMNQCSNCRALALCGGGCPYNSYKNNGDIFSANDKRSCIQADKFLQWMVDKIVKRFGNNEFHEVTAEEKLTVLGNINLDKYIPLGEYSQYGEFKLEPRLK